ncbi:hypothetical protein [Ferrimicrobium acidiphilum]|uniref:hypothetical protein n=1 Tax=Ferrimicrobium acidiphilum TaxID=121039 RepID=UPI0023F08BC3|nr:hypothetical protein [Ferrimicrobium acidiphilum]
MASDNLPKKSGKRKATFRELALQEWTMRIGEDAATHRMANYRWLNRAWLASSVGFALVLIGGFNKIQFLVVLGILAFVVWLALQIRSWFEIIRMYRSASSALGTTLNMHRFPPRGVEKYRKWCDKNNLRPYPFKVLDEDGSQPL